MRHHHEDFDDEDGRYVVIERHESGSGIGTFLLGAAIGAGIALLFAPRSGAETRADIRRRARNAKNSASRVAHDVTDSVTGTFQDARRRVEEQIDTARNAIETKKEQMRRAMEAGRVAAAEARVDIEERLSETKAAYNAGAEVAREAREVRSRRRPPATTSSLAEE
jgi:gas vesicle protein